MALQRARRYLACSHTRCVSDTNSLLPNASEADEDKSSIISVISDDDCEAISEEFVNEAIINIDTSDRMTSPSKMFSGLEEVSAVDIEDFNPFLEDTQVKSTLN